MKFLSRPYTEGIEHAPTMRSGHCAVRWKRFLIIFGGYCNNERGDATRLNVLDFATHKWTEVNADGTTPDCETGGCVVNMDDEIYLFGGWSVKPVMSHRGSAHITSLHRLSLEEVEFGVVRATWSDVDVRSRYPLNGRDKHAGFGYNSKLYFFGGFGPCTHSLLAPAVFQEDNENMPIGWNNELLVFDTVTFQWERPAYSGVPPSPRAAHSFTCVGNKGYVIGGRGVNGRMNDVHVLDLETMEWRELVPASEHAVVPPRRSWHAATMLENGRTILTYGGMDAEGHSLEELWLFDTVDVRWIPIGGRQARDAFSDMPLEYRIPSTSADLDLAPIHTPIPRLLWHSGVADPSTGRVYYFGGSRNGPQGAWRRARDDQARAAEQQARQERAARNAAGGVRRLRSALRNLFGARRSEERNGAGAAAEADATNAEEDGANDTEAPSAVDHEDDVSSIDEDGGGSTAHNKALYVIETRFPSLLSLCFDHYVTAAASASGKQLTVLKEEAEVAAGLLPDTLQRKEWLARLPPGFVAVHAWGGGEAGPSAQ